MQLWPLKRVIDKWNKPENSDQQLKNKSDVTMKQDCKKLLRQKTTG